MHASGVASRDGLGRTHCRGQLLQGVALAALAAAQFVKRGDEQFGHFRGQTDGNSGAFEELIGLALNQLHLLGQTGDGLDRLKVEATLKRGAHLVDAAVACVGRGDHVEADAGEQRTSVRLQFGNRHDAVTEDR